MGRVIKESDTEELELFTVRLRGTQIGHDLMCDRLAWSQHNDMVAISCHGPLPQLKALRASLLANNCMVDFQGYCVSPRLHKNTSNQYRVQLHKHAYSDGHLVAHQDYRGLILNLSDEVLFRMLKEDTYSPQRLPVFFPGSARFVDANGQPSGMSFKISCDGQEIPFRIPANPVGVLRALKKNAPYSKQNPEQAQRVAWRIMKDYIEVQLAVVESEQAQFAEVFMGYAIVQGGQTMFQRFMENPSRLLSAGTSEPTNVVEGRFQAVNE